MAFAKRYLSLYLLAASRRRLTRAARNDLPYGEHANLVAYDVSGEACGH